MKKRIEVALNSLVALLQGFIACGKNAVFKADHIAARMLETASKNLSFEALYALNACLSPDRVLAKAHTFTEGKIQALVSKGTRALELPRRIIAAIDFTEREYYGDKGHKQAMGSKGGKYVQRFLELSVVKPARFISALMVDQFTNNKVKLITQLIDGFSAAYTKTRLELLLLDRGFFAKAVVALLAQKGIKFIMPAVRDRAIKPMVEAAKQLKHNFTVEYEFGKTKVYLVFVRVDDEVLVYMTNTRFSPLKVHLLYKKRWQIETNFREQNQFQFRTTTRDFVIRYLAFAIAGLLFNAWQVQRSKRNQLRGYVFRDTIGETLGICWLPFIHRERG